MRYPADIQKIEREKRQKKREEMCNIASPLKIKRKMKAHILTRSKYLPESRESQPVERKGEVLSKNSTDTPKDLSKSRESWPEERKDEASSSSSMVGVVQIEMTTSEILSDILVQNQELAIATADNAYSSVGNILQIDLRIEPGEASIWSWLDVLGQISARLMIYRPLYGNWVIITPKFGSHNIIIQYSNPMVIPPHANTPHSRTA
jgi:hypothetical protein